MVEVVTFRNSLFVFLCVILGYSNVYSQGSVDLNLTEEEQQWIAENPVIRAANERSFYPFDFTDENGGAAGFSVDYFNLLARKAGINVEYANGYSWGDLLGMLERKEIDVAPSIIRNTEREKFLIFTEPYVNSPMIYIGLGGSDRIESLNDLRGKRIGVVKGGVPDITYSSRYPELDIVRFNNILESLSALKSGETDIAAVLKPVAEYYIGESPEDNIEIIGDRFFPDTGNESRLRVGIRNDWPILRSILEKAKDAISQNEYQFIANKWNLHSLVERRIALTQEELKWLSNTDKVRVAFSTTQPFSIVHEDGEIDGMIGDYLKIFSEELGIPFEWVGNETWAEGMEMLGRGEVDLLPLIISTPERREVLSFTEPIFSSARLIFARDGNDIFANMEALSGRKIAQVAGIAAVKMIREDYPEVEIVEVADIPEALHLVSTGEVDAYVGGIPFTAYHIVNGGYSQIKVVGDTPYILDYSMGVSTEKPLLASIMKKAVNSISPREKAEITRDWLSLSIEEQPNYELLVRIVLSFAAVILIIMLWNYKLRNEVKRRKETEEKLIRSRKAAEKANKAKSTFLANMSHEIRTPLNAIIGFSDVMLMDADWNKKEATYKDYIKDINYSGQHLATVINDILDLSKIEAGKWTLNEEDFSIKDTIEKSIMMLGPEAEQKDIKIIYDNEDNDENLTLYGDPHAIDRVVINLLSNAVKFTDNGGEIKINTHVLVDDTIQIQISDTGIGIAPDRLKYVMMPFEQARGEYDLNQEGTGLGLAIVKKLVDLHGGIFKLESELGKGTTASMLFSAKH
ncbi:transporter substrate-binding domain-containing protein [Pseudemcibacter aquimaris]|nr:transporter substrate-binding domain-containing protein [Pseudemcibacter aquimaris]